jgi:sialic acid synthase SpsE
LSVQIGRIALDQRVLVVAEIGNNHEGRLDLARALVRAAATSGADAVKFQTYRTDAFVSRVDAARHARLRSFELSQDAFRELHDLARELGLLFLSTALDLESARFLEPLVDAYKVASGDNNFFPLLRALSHTGKPLVVSSGMSGLAHLVRTKAFIEDEWRSAGHTGELAILHCVSGYPAPPDQVHLRAIPVLARELGCVVGYSDHTLGIEACLAAVALGARIIEKHFTLDKNQSDFRDHEFSAEPREMSDLVERVRRIETLLGRAEKTIQPCEQPIIAVARRSIVAARPLDAGHCLEVCDVTWIRPATGLPPGDEERLVGRRLVRALAFGEPILPSDLE